jgi:hypothetical protein
VCMAATPPRASTSAVDSHCAADREVGDHLFVHTWSAFGADCFQHVCRKVFRSDCSIFETDFLRAPSSVTGSVLTVVVYTLAMRIANSRIGATHFSAFAAVEVIRSALFALTTCNMQAIGKTVAASCSGALCTMFGYNCVFGLGVLLACAPIFLVRRVQSVRCTF